MNIKSITGIILALAAGASFAAQSTPQQTRADTAAAVERTADAPASAVSAKTGRTREEVRAEARQRDDVAGATRTADYPMANLPAAGGGTRSEVR
jgi:hypothetical protein